MNAKIPIFAMLLWVIGTTAGVARQSLIPFSWTEEARTSPEEPLRYSSPDGTASLSLYASGADRRTGPPSLAKDDERITYKRVTPRFIAVSGFKGDRIFYRKSNLACRGTRWHNIELEYNAADKRKFDALVTRVAHGMNRYDSDCRNSASHTSGGLVKGTR
jgi:serine/threonine-protein kinase